MGCFAFAIFDRRARPASISRANRFGEKPLYWSKGSGRNRVCERNVGTRIASEREPNPSIPRALPEIFFAHGFIPAPNALLQGVYKLCAGIMDYLRQSRRERSMNGNTGGFRVEPDESLGPPTPSHGLVDELRVSPPRGSPPPLDVRRGLLGFFLSGGIDSSTCCPLPLLVRCSSKLRDQNVHRRLHRTIVR